jgi:hypothetical protein
MGMSRKKRQETGTKNQDVRTRCEIGLSKAFGFVTLSKGVCNAHGKSKRAWSRNKNQDRQHLGSCIFTSTVKSKVTPQFLFSFDCFKKGLEITFSK